MGRNILCDKYKEGKFPPSVKCEISSGTKRSLLLGRDWSSKTLFSAEYDLWQVISKELVKQKERDCSYCDEEQIGTPLDIGMAILAHLAQHLFF